MVGERAMDELRPPEQPRLAQDKVCYVGQPIAVVVAQDPYRAREGVERITEDYEPLLPVLDPSQPRVQTRQSFIRL
jgi:carbon-monoxide dehydrogenase large subunit